MISLKMKKIQNKIKKIIYGISQNKNNNMKTYKMIKIMKILTLVTLEIWKIKARARLLLKRIKTKNKIKTRQILKISIILSIKIPKTSPSSIFSINKRINLKSPKKF